VVIRPNSTGYNVRTTSRRWSFLRFNSVIWLRRIRIVLTSFSVMNLKCVAKPSVWLARRKRFCNTRATWPEFTKFFVTRRGVIGDVNALIHVAILPSVVEYQRTAWRWGILIFADWRQKSVTIPTSLERSRKENRFDHAHPYLYPENFMKIGLVHSEIIGFEGDR